MRLRSCITFYLCLCFLLCQIQPALSYTMLPEMLFQTGLKYYTNGRYDLALQEFKKALIANPDFEPAQRYIALLTQEAAPESPQEITQPDPEQAPETQSPAHGAQSKEQAIAESLDAFERQETGRRKADIPAPKTTYASRADTQVQFVEQNLRELVSPVELERNKEYILRGAHIFRFLITSEGILTIERTAQNDLRIVGSNYGHTYVHFWDQGGRSTVEFIVTPKKFAGPTFDEEMRAKEERGRNIKLRYAIDWSSFEDGKDFHQLHRAYYLYTHNLSLTGDTPYGVFDSSILIQRLNSEYSPASFSVGLEEGLWGPFKGFSLRGFDFTPAVSNLVFPGAVVRGAQFRSPVAENKFDYTVFWGREKSSGILGPYVSPDYIRSQDAYLSGVNLRYAPQNRQLYSISAFHGYGSDRNPDLNAYGYDAKVQYGLGRWDTAWETGYDNEHFAHQLTATVVENKMQLTEELRDINKDYHSMTGLGWRAGEFGSLTSLFIKPNPMLDINSSLDIFLDRLYPNPDQENRWNENLYIDSTVYFDPLTRARVDYSFQDNQGRLSPMVSHNAGIGFYRTVQLIKTVQAFATYRFQDNAYSNAPGVDFINNKVSLGLRCNLIGDLYYFLNQEYNWTRRKLSDERAHPRATETGLDWNGRLGKSAFFGSSRFTYRNEEGTGSPVSFLAGQDYLEWYTELSYRPNPDIEAYLSGRLRRILPENRALSKSAEVSLNAGMRYLWDTGVRWEPIGMVEGYVFKDYNFDGIKQNDEPAIPGVKIWLGKSRSRVTNEHGYYLFPNVNARKAVVYLDSTSIPANFVLTTPATHEVAIRQSGIAAVNFGLASKTEISGMIFEDIDGDGKFSPIDRPMKGITVELEDGSQVTSDGFGKYVFNKVNAGSHTIKLDLRNLPPEYIPTVSIFKEAALLEGASFTYHFPLKKVK